MPNARNQQVLKQLQDKVGQASAVVITDFSSTSANDQNTLRREIKQAGGELFVAKNTLIDLAVGKGKVSESLQGMNAAVFSYQDAIAPIKALFAFQKKTEKLVIKQGLMDGQVLSADQVKNLSKLPSKAELIAKLLQVLKSPGQGLVNVLMAGPRNLVYAMNAIKEKKA